MANNVSLSDEFNILEHRAMFSQEAALILAEVKAYRAMKANGETCLVDRIRGAAKLLIDCELRGLFDALAGDDLHELAERVHAALSVQQLESGED